MKLARIVLLLSLVANLVLAGVWLRRRPAKAASANLRATSAVPARASAAPTDDDAPPPLDEKMWSRLALGSDADYVAQLRSERFPADVIRALLSVRIRARYADLLRALLPAGRDEYWRGTRWSAATRSLSPDARAQRRAIEREIHEAEKLALGADFGGADPEQRDNRVRKYGDLPAEKVDQLEAIVADYDEMSAAVHDRMNGAALREDREQLRLLEKERRADLATLLSPAELAEYDLRSSPSAAAVRQRLTYFKPTEAEFRALASVQLEFDREYGTSNLSDAEETRRRNAEKELTARIQAILPPERFAEYQLVSDPSFRNTVSFVRSFNFDEAVAREVFTLQRDITAQAATIRGQSDISPEQRAAALTALYSTATAQLEKTIGAPGLEAYRRGGPGGWVNKLAPTPARPAAPSKP